MYEIGVPYTAEQLITAAIPHYKKQQKLFSGRAMIPFKKLLEDAGFKTMKTNLTVYWLPVQE